MSPPRIEDTIRRNNAVKRMKLLAAMALLAGVIAAVIGLASPYAPVVEPCPEDIEAIWAIEDAREESETPLITALQNHGMPLAYDREANTFYCTLGLEQGGSWPQLRLTAPQAAGVSLVMTDDYSFDWCSDAVREGYAYQLLTYTDTAYFYTQIVFTGLPQIVVETSGKITVEDSPVHVSVSAYGEEPLVMSARMHLRGASTLTADKKGYKIEFTRERNGAQRKISVTVPGFGEADDIALLAGIHDESKLRERLSWAAYNEIAKEGEPFGRREAQYAELFIDGQYMGLYLMLEPVDIQEELTRAGGQSGETDGVYRTAVLSLAHGRETYEHPRRFNTGYELYAAPAAGEPFAPLAAYLALMDTEDDGQFVEDALACIDVDGLLRYVLYVQAAGLTDNFFNNMYIWAHRRADGYVYRFAPWDADLTWGLKPEDIGSEYENWMVFPIADRMLSLNAGGMRQRMQDMWAQMRKGVFSEAWLEGKIAAFTAELVNSGAYARDAARWGLEAYEPDGYEILSYAEMRFALLDEEIARAAGSDEPVSWLENTDYEIKGISMRPDMQPEMTD